ncbi:MAG: DUF2752 domain-containing protein [Roseburia sp.]|nr:DUF2752 domain-containing protein [Roseburia sp.]MCM1277666.1 DUF2752 domain-containing protein [Robinsoniella sp.]
MFERIKKDWENYKVGIGAAALYLLLSTFLLGDACPSRLLLKKPCPGCGLTRAVFYFCTFRWKTACSMNAMVFPLMLFLLWSIYFRYGKGKKIPFFHGGIALLCIGALIYFCCRSAMGIL